MKYYLDDDDNVNKKKLKVTPFWIDPEACKKMKFG